MSSPFFSVIIPTYNRAAFVTKAVKSVMSQAYKNFELIIVDDGSEDNTSEVLKPYLSETVNYYRIKNSERAVARNYGIKKARGNYITFLDSDDMYYSNYLENAYSFLIKNAYPDFFHQAYEIKTESGKIISVSRPESSDLLESISKGNFLSCMGVFIKREITSDYKFNEDRELSGSEDWEYWVRLIANFGLTYSHKVCAAMIVHDERSVLSVNEESLVKRKNLALKYAFNDENVTKVFEKYFKLMNAYWDTYIALHLILAFKNNRGMSYFFNALKKYPGIILDLRSLSIIKIYIQNTLRFRK